MGVVGGGRIGQLIMERLKVGWKHMVHLLHHALVTSCACTDQACYWLTIAEPAEASLPVQVSVIDGEPGTA